MYTENENKNLPVPIGDGFDGHDGEDDGRIKKGCWVKFTDDYEWEADGVEILENEEFIVVDILKVVQKWFPDKSKRPETRILAPNEPFPNIKKLNDETPRSEWREKFGNFVGPYEVAYVVYWFAERTKQRYTYLTATDGGGIAVRELRDNTQLERKMSGQRVFPVVGLRDIFMKTGYGGRQRPHFLIKRYIPFGPDTAVLAGPAQTDGRNLVTPKQAAIEAKSKVRRASPPPWEDTSDDEPDVRAAPYTDED